MTLCTGVDLVSEFQRFQDLEWHEEDTVRMLRFHLHLSQRTGHLANIKQTIQFGRQYSGPELLIYAEYLAYLINFEDMDLEDEAEYYTRAIAGGIFFSESARKCYAMLVRPETLHDLVRIVSRQIDDLTLVSNLQQLIVKLNLFSKKLMWELKKSHIGRCKPTQGMQGLLDQLMMQLLCNQKYGEKEQILMEIARLTACALEYLKGDANCYKIRLMLLMESWLTLKIYKEEVKKEVMKTLTISLRTFGMYKPELFYQFFNLNAAMVEQVEYIELLSAFLGKLDKNQPINQPETNKIFSSLFTAVVRAPSGSTIRSYRSKSLMFDQIVKIFTFSSCDLSKHLSQYFQEAQNSSHEAFIWSIMLIFNQRISAETMHNIESHKLRYLGKTRQGLLYEQILQYYCEEGLDMEGFIINPEEKDDFMWEILLLRSTVTINYTNLCQIDKVFTLVANLTKIMLLDFFPEECLEIIEKVLENEAVYSMEELQDISFQRIIESVKPTLMKLVQNQSSNDGERLSQCFRNFGRVLRLITKRYEVAELSGPKLFGSVIRLSNNLPDRFATPAFMKYQSQLLELAMPIVLTEVTEEEFSQCMSELVKHIQRFRNITDFLLYLEMMSRAIEHTRLRTVFSSLHARMEMLIQNQPLNIINAYNISYYILSGSRINKEVLDQSWAILSEFGSFQYSHLFFTVIALQQYAASWVSEHCGNHDYEQFLVYQLSRGEALLLQLDRLEDGIIILLRLEEFLAFRQTLLVFLQEMLMLYIEIDTPTCLEPLTINGYLFRAYLDMKSNRPSAPTFEESPAIRQYWCNCQLLVLVMVPSMLRRQKSQTGRQIMETLNEIDDKFEWLKKLYPKGHEDQLQDFNLCLNCELFELINFAKSKFQQLST